MASRTHLAAPLLFTVAVLLILYVSLYPFRFATGGPSMPEALGLLTWARASRSDMLNNVLLYAPFGFCLTLIVEPRLGRMPALAASLLAGATLSLSMELLQASIPPRVPSLTDLTLNTLSALGGAIGGSTWHALGARMAPQGAPLNRARAVAASLVVTWLVMLLWPLLPDASLGQLKRAVRPLFTPQLQLSETLAYLLGWLIVAEAVFHLVRRQRAIDLLLVIIAVVLVGRAFVAGSVLSGDMIVALLLLLPALVLASRLGERTRAGMLAAGLLAWLAWPATAALLGPTHAFDFAWPGLAEFLAARPSVTVLAGTAFNYLALGWLLAGAGLLPHVAAGATVIVGITLHLVAMGTPGTIVGWMDFTVAIAAAVIVARWLPRRKWGHA